MAWLAPVAGDLRDPGRAEAIVLVGALSVRAGLGPLVAWLAAVAGDLREPGRAEAVGASASRTQRARTVRVMPAATASTHTTARLISNATR
jgi:predicted permease